MFRKLLLLTAVASALFAQLPLRKPTALDKPALEAYLRHLFVWPEQVTVAINDPVPGPMAGYLEVKVRGSSGPQSQDESFYVSADGQKIIRGVVYDVNQNPFKAENDKIKTDSQPAFGTLGAPVVIAVFSDYECPFCREAAKMLRDNLLKTYPKEVHAYFFDFPLEVMHPWARSAAMAGRCVFRQSASSYWDFHDWMFENQKDITPENLKEKVLEFAKAKGKDLDLKQLTSCIDTKETSAEVDRTLAIGKSLNVNQTPTIFINGRRLGGAPAWSDLKFIIDYEIAYQKTAKNAGEDCGCEVKLPNFGGAPAAVTPGLGK